MATADAQRLHEVAREVAAYALNTASSMIYRLFHLNAGKDNSRLGICPWLLIKETEMFQLICGALHAVSSGIPCSGAVPAGGGSGVVYIHIYVFMCACVNS